MPFNAFEATNVRLKKNRPFNDGTAGTPKTPQSASSMSKAELQALGERMGWDSTKELTMRELKEMDSAQYRYHEVLNPKFQAAFERESNKKTNDENIAAWKIRKMWEQGTKEEIDAALVEVQRFVAAHPQFIGSNEANRQTVVNWLVKMNLPCTYQNLIQAFQDLAKDGKLTLLDGGVEVTGESLSQSPHLRVLLEPKSKPLPAEESADAFYQSHPELHPSKPKLVQMAEQQIEATQKARQDAEAATVRSGYTRFIDYGRKRK